MLKVAIKYAIPYSKGEFREMSIVLQLIEMSFFRELRSAELVDDVVDQKSKRLAWTKNGPKIHKVSFNYNHRR